MTGVESSRELLLEKEKTMKKLLFIVLLSALLIQIAPQASPANLNNSVASHKKQTVQAKANETAQTSIPEVQEPSPQPPKVTEPEHPIGCENYRSLVSQYNWNVNVALNVMRAESGCNPYAIGDGHLTFYQGGAKYGMSCGMFQVRYLPGRPTCSTLQIPSENIAYAYNLYKASGWKPWSVCNKGIVRCY